MRASLVRSFTKLASLPAATQVKLGSAAAERTVPLALLAVIVAVIVVVVDRGRSRPTDFAVLRLVVATFCYE